MPSLTIGKLRLKNNLILAPMAGITDLPFRLTARTYGCALCFTEMISAVGLVRASDKTYTYLRSSPEDKPLGFQLFGSDADILAEAARIVTDQGADLIDINMGCPVKKVIRSGSGAALMKNPGSVHQILSKVRQATDLPLTIKIRAGWDHNNINALQIASIAEDCGIDAVTVHPRTAKQGFSGSADWKLIAEIKRNTSLPVIANGDVRTPADALKIMETTGCAMIMIGRGSLGNPWIFQALSTQKPEDKASLPLLADRQNMIYFHLCMNIKLYGEQAGIKRFRKNLLWYTKGLRGGALFRQQVTSIDNPELLRSTIRRFFNMLEEEL